MVIAKKVSNARRSFRKSDGFATLTLDIPMWQKHTKLYKTQH